MNNSNNLNYLNSIKNKEFLWNLLYEKKVFNNIPNNMLSNTKEIFENSINNSLNYIMQNNISNNNLLNLNKLIVKNLNDDFNEFKYNLLKSQETKNILKNEKIEIFNIELKKQKQNMDDILILKKPEEIDFSDKKLHDKPLDTNMMNNILEKMEKERNIILSTKIKNSNVINDNVINDKNKILDNNIIEEIMETNNEINNTTNNTTNNEINNANKEKIYNLEDLLINKNELKKRNSKVNCKDINQVIYNEYRHENNTNLNIKIDNMYTILNKILENQEKIINKLNI